MYPTDTLVPSTTRFRSTGLYPGPLPSGIGSEAVGVVEAAAPDVTNFAIGDHVGYAMGPPGAYASVRTVCAATAVPIPQNIPDELAAAVLLKGMTTEFLVERCARIAPGQSALVHAAARSEEHTSELQSLMRHPDAV